MNLNLNHETLLIAGMLAEPEVIPPVMRELPEGGAWFENGKLGKLYDSVVKVFKEYGTVDVAILSSDAGVDPLWAVEVSSTTYTGRNAVVHARLVSEKHFKKVADSKLSGAVGKFRESDTPYATLGELEGELRELRMGFQRSSIVDAGALVGEFEGLCDDIQAGRLTVVATFGFDKLDKATGGMSQGNLVVVSAREKSGKTTLMLQTCVHNAREGRPVLIFSSEMSRRDLMMRVALYETKTSYIRYVNNHLRPEEWDKLRKWGAEFKKLPFYVRDGVFSVSDIAVESEAYVEQRGVRLIAVDYIQRVNPASGSKEKNREQEIAGISRDLKNVAMKLGVAVIALSQVNEDGRARESRAIEHDMDKMIFVEREDGATLGEVKLRQRLGRSGTGGEIKLVYDNENGIWRDEEPRASAVEVASRNAFRVSSEREDDDEEAQEVLNL